MAEKCISHKFIRNSIEETRNYFIKEMDQNELMSNKHKIVCTTLSYIEHLLSLISAVIGWVFFFDFASVVGIPRRIMTFAIGLKIGAVTA